MGASNMVDASYEESKGFLFDCLEEAESLDMKVKVQSVLDVISKVLERQLCFSVCYLQLYWDEIEREAENARLKLMEINMKKVVEEESVGDGGDGAKKKKNKKKKDREKELKRLEREKEQLRLQRQEEAEKKEGLLEREELDDDRYPIPQEKGVVEEDSESEEEEEEEDGDKVIEEDFTDTFYDSATKKNEVSSSLSKSKIGASNSKQSEFLKTEKTRIEAERQREREREKEKERARE